ncbi:MAG: ComF family protein [Planctomycetaceae bacterium]
MGLLHALLDALAPPLCCLCRGPPGPLPWLCAPCARGLDLAAGPCCLRCGAPRPLEAPLCAHCPDWPKLLRGARAAAPHRGTARELVHALKIAGRMEAARPLGALVAAAARALPWGAAAIVAPVPQHRSARRRRRFNHAGEIARVAAAALRLRFVPRLLMRVRPAGETVYRSASGRWRAARGAFRAIPAARGTEVLLVDDVLTTGATLAACTRALRRRGAAAVWAVTATRARCG